MFYFIFFLLPFHTSAGSRRLWLHARFGCWTGVLWLFIWSVFCSLHFYLHVRWVRWRFFSRFVSCRIFRFPFFLFSYFFLLSSKHFLSAGLMRFVCVIREQTCTNTKSEKVNPNVSAHRNNHIIHIVFTHYDCVTYAVFPISPLEYISRRRHRFRRPHTFAFIAISLSFSFLCLFHVFMC